MSNILEQEISAALSIAANPIPEHLRRKFQRAPRVDVKLSDARIAELSKVWGADFGFNRAVHNYRAAVFHNDRRRTENALRNYIPEFFNLVWLAQDAAEQNTGAFNPPKFIGYVVKA